MTGCLPGVSPLAVLPMLTTPCIPAPIGLRIPGLSRSPLPLLLPTTVITGEDTSSGVLGIIVRCITMSLCGIIKRRLLRRYVGVRIETRRAIGYHRRLNQNCCTD